MLAADPRTPIDQRRAAAERPRLWSPRGEHHQPRAAMDVRLALVEPTARRHTGDVSSERTRSIAKQLR